MYYDIYTIEEVDDEVISESILYNSKNFNITHTINSVIDYIEKEFRGCIKENIINISKVKSRLNNYNYFIFEDFDKHKHTFVLRKWDANCNILNKDVFTKI